MTQSVQEIYRSALSSLSPEERLELAALILRELAASGYAPGRRLSAVGLINSFPARRGFKTSAEADRYLRGERDSWEH
jgi:hypothetical protein